MLASLTFVLRRIGCSVEEQERDILSKAAAWFAKQGRQGVHAVFELVNANQANFSVRAMCKVLQVSASGFYAWQERAPSKHAMDDAVLSERIRLIHSASGEIYGSPNIHAELRDEGLRVGRKRVGKVLGASKVLRSHWAGGLQLQGSVPRRPDPARCSRRAR